MEIAGVLKLEELTWRAFLALPRDTTLFVVPISPLEEHGPHLPLGCDLFDAKAFGLETARVLSARRPGLTFVFYPKLGLGTDTFPYLGSIEIRQRVIRDLAFDIGQSLGREGFKYVMFMNGHGGPSHNVALDEAATRLWRRGVRAIAPFGAIVENLFLGKYNSRIQEHMKTLDLPELSLPMNQDYHAGAFETSLMMHLCPGLVTAEREGLADFSVPLRKLRWTTALKEGPGLGYLGAPASGNAELGKALLELLAGELATLCEELLDGQPVLRRARSRLYWVPFFWTDRWWHALAIAATLVMIWLASLY